MTTSLALERIKDMEKAQKEFDDFIFECNTRDLLFSERYNEKLYDLDGNIVNEGPYYEVYNKETGQCYGSYKLSDIKKFVSNFPTSKNKMIGSEGELRRTNYCESQFDEFIKEWDKYGFSLTITFNALSHIKQDKREIHYTLNFPFNGKYFSRNFETVDSFVNGWILCKKHFDSINEALKEND